MKIAFLTEMGFSGPVYRNHTNMRTEFAWMAALNAVHYPITHFNGVKDFDVVFIIFPKGDVSLNAVGSKMVDVPNKYLPLFQEDFVGELKQHNKKVFFVQEGPSWFFNEYEIINQFHYNNAIVSSDGIFVHNETDRNFYSGLFDKKTYVMPTLMIEDLVKDIVPVTEDKTIIGGNFCRWYGGFQSYIVAQEFVNRIYVPSSHAARQEEFDIEGLTHLPRLEWLDWMKTLSSFKYAVHMMPTVAAGTFSLNCAYFGIPCIGNEKVDTQRICHPNLSVDVDDVQKAKDLAWTLQRNPEFFKMCCEEAKYNYTKFAEEEFLKKINEALNG